MIVHFLYFQIIEGFNSLIPEDMQDFLNISALFDEIIDLLVGEPIDKSEQFQCES